MAGAVVNFKNCFILLSLLASTPGPDMGLQSGLRHRFGKIAKQFSPALDKRSNRTRRDSY